MAERRFLFSVTEGKVDEQTAIKLLKEVKTLYSLGRHWEPQSDMKIVIAKRSQLKLDDLKLSAGKIPSE